MALRIAVKGQGKEGGKRFTIAPIHNIARIAMQMEDVDRSGKGSELRGGAAAKRQCEGPEGPEQP